MYRTRQSSCGRAVWRAAPWTRCPASIWTDAIIACRLPAAATVAAAGLVGFVGLVVPAIARACGARLQRPALLLSALVGAALLVSADVAARTVRAPAELPLGAVTALVGVPFFLHRLRRMTA